MKEIQLTKGKVALVDDEDFDYLSQWKWQAHKDRDGSYRVHRTDYSGGTKRTMVMARVIMKTPDKMRCDHIDHNPLNNQRKNLRNATSSQNNMNAFTRSDNYLGEKNIIRFGKGFRVQIYKSGKHVFNKVFKNLEEAKQARDKELIKHHGEFACGFSR